MRAGATLYRLFDADDELMYIGVTENFGTRLYQHEITLRFGATKIARWELEEYDAREDALVAEAIATKHEKPRFNRQLDWGRLNCDCAGCEIAKKLHRGVSLAEYDALMQLAQAVAS